MNSLWGLVLGILLWAGIVAGLISVVRDCMKDRELEPIFPYQDEEDCERSCELGSLEILPRQRQGP